MPVIDEQVINEISTYKDETLRDYQEDSKQKIYNLWKEVDSVLLQMPTGTGKTKLFVSIINDLARYSVEHFKEKGEYFKVLILAHRKELIDQITNEITNVFHLKCSKIEAGSELSPRWSEPICVASVQTLTRRIWSWKGHPFDLIIVDEAHHAIGKSYRRILYMFKESKFLGVTATPYRLNGEGLASEFQRIIISPSIKEFIEAGWLSNYDYYSIKTTNDFYINLDTIPLDSYGDYSLNSLWNYCKPDKIQAEIVATYLKYAKGKKGIVYTINQQHNKKLVNEFRKSGISAYGIDSHTKTEEREEIIRRFRLGEITVLCNVNIFTEGFDCPDVEFVQLARPTKSLGLYLQQVGRGLRISNYKEKVIFLDNVGLYNRFGFPSSKRQWAHHFGGKNLTEFGKQYVEEIDTEPTFPLGSRNSDLSEGSEEVSLIETTGLNEVKKNTEDLFLASYEKELRPIIESIFQINKETHRKYIEEYDIEDNVHFKAELIEDILNPCPIITLETDDKDAVLKRLEKDYKPIINNGEIDYVKYENWDDYETTVIDKVKKLFKKQLAMDQSTNFTLLNKFTANQLRVFFERYYGKGHHMTKRFIKYCTDYSFDDTWNIIKANRFMRQYVKTIEWKEDFNGIEIIRCEYESYE